jgi:hypothetical protein
MKIGMTRIGILENEFPPQTWIDFAGPATIDGFLRFLANRCGPELTGALFDRNQLKPHIVILLNGRSIRALPEGVNSPIKDGDHIVFSIMIDGG